MKRFIFITITCIFLMGMGWFQPPIDQPTADRIPHEPILFIHGLFGHPLTWYNLQTWLANEGFDQDLMYAPQITDNFSMCSPNHITQIENEIDAILSETGADKITLIGHSRGGAAIMAFMHFSDHNGSVATVITLAGANHYVCDMVYGWPQRDDTPGDALYTSIYAYPHDGSVPAYVARLDGAHNVEYSELTHNDFLQDEAVFEDVLEALMGGGSN